MAGVAVKFEDWRQKIVGQRVSLAWQGYGSTIFLEFGKLTPTYRPNGESGYGQGEITIMLQWGWRMEDETSILCGHGNENDEITAGLLRLTGLELADAALVGRLPELSLSFSNTLYVTSFWPCEGDPSWTIFDRMMDGHNALYIEQGALVLAR